MIGVVYEELPQSVKVYSVNLESIPTERQVPVPMTLLKEHVHVIGVAKLKHKDFIK